MSAILYTTPPFCANVAKYNTSQVFSIKMTPFCLCNFHKVRNISYDKNLPDWIITPTEHRPATLSRTTGHGWLFLVHVTYVSRFSRALAKDFFEKKLPQNCWMLRNDPGSAQRNVYVTNQSHDKPGWFFRKTTLFGVNRVHGSDARERTANGHELTVESVFIQKLAATFLRSVLSTNVAMDTRSVEGQRPRNGPRFHVKCTHNLNNPKGNCFYLQIMSQQHFLIHLNCNVLSFFRLIVIQIMRRLLRN